MREWFAFFASVRVLSHCEHLFSFFFSSPTATLFLRFCSFAFFFDLSIRLLA